MKSITFHRISLLLITFHYTLLHTIVSHSYHYIPSYSIALHCILLNTISSNYIPLYSIAFHYISLLSLYSIALYCISLHIIAYHSILFYSILFHIISLYYWDVYVERVISFCCQEDYFISEKATLRGLFHFIFERVISLSRGPYREGYFIPLLIGLFFRKGLCQEGYFIPSYFIPFLKGSFQPRGLFHCHEGYLIIERAILFHCWKSHFISYQEGHHTIQISFCSRWLCKMLRIEDDFEHLYPLTMQR